MPDISDAELTALKAAAVQWWKQPAGSGDQVLIDALLADRAAAVVQARAEVEATHRDLVSRLGFGNNITEPMADNDTIVAWFEERGREAAEWVESQRWRDECYAAGHPDDEDCYEHDPSLRLERVTQARAEDRARIEAAWELVAEWETASKDTQARADHPDAEELRESLMRESGSLRGAAIALRSALSNPAVIHAPECNPDCEGDRHMLLADTSDETARAEDRARIEALDDSLCDALMAAHQGRYDGKTVEHHLERLIERVRALAATEDGDPT